MTFQATAVYNQGLSYLSNGNTIHFCSAEPSTFAEIATLSLANKSGIVVGPLANSTGGGRQRTIPGFTDGNVTKAGTATHWALVNAPSSELMLAMPLGAAKDVVLGTPARLSDITISLKPPTGIFLNTVYDNGLNVLTNNSEELHLCTSLVSTFSALAAATVAIKTNPTISTSRARSLNDGYEVELSAITDGTTTKTTNAVTHFSIVDRSNSRILVSGTTPTQSIAANNPFQTPAITIGVPKPAAA